MSLVLTDSFYYFIISVFYVLKRPFDFIVLLNRVYFYLYLIDSAGARFVFRYDLVTSTSQHFSSPSSQQNPFGGPSTELGPLTVIGSSGGPLSLGTHPQPLHEPDSSDSEEINNY